MEIHPRTLAATFRDMAREAEARAQAFTPGSPNAMGMLGEADGLRVAAEHLEQLADAEFERIMAEHGVRRDLDLDAYQHVHRECGPDCVVTGDACPPPPGPLDSHEPAERMGGQF